eukprot:403373022
MNLNNLTCKGCKKIYNLSTRQPQFMQCGHVICLKCFEDHEKSSVKNKDGKYQCPIKDSCLQPQISKFVASHFVEMLEDAEIFNIFCDKHPKNTAQYFCKQTNLLICETCMLTDHSNHLQPESHIHFSSEAKDIFTKNILPYLQDKKEKLDSILESFVLSSENEMTFSATNFKSLIKDTEDILIGNANDKNLVQKLDLSKQQTLSQNRVQPQNDINYQQQLDNMNQYYDDEY